MKKLLLLCIILSFLQLPAFSQSCLPEGITFTTQAQIDSFQVDYPGCREIEGDVTISGNDIRNLDGLQALTLIGGELWISNNIHLENINGLAGITSIGTSLYIGNNSILNSLSGLEGLIAIGGDLTLSSHASLLNITGLANLSLIGGGLGIEVNDALISLTGLENLTTIGYLYITDNQALINMNGLEGLSSVGGYLSIYNNANLISLSGLNNLNSIKDQLEISFNPLLTGLTGLESLNSIEGGIRITHNQSLSSLSGIDNIDAGTITDLEISRNYSLSSCDVQGLCDYLASPGGVVTIYNNAVGCANPSEIATACGFTIPCLPFGDYYLLSQTNIDNFQALYPGCTTLEGYTLISGEDVSNLNGLDSVIAIGSELMIYNNSSLTSLSGLDGITFIGGGLFILDNLVLINISALDQLNIDSLIVLEIVGNHSLSNCDIQSVCDFIANPKPGSNLSIHENATGCYTEQEVEAVCLEEVQEVVSRQSSVSSYPNPVLDQVTFKIHLQNPAKVNLTVFNSMGQEVATILDEALNKGNYRVIWNLEGLLPGIYFYHITSGRLTSSGKLVVVR